MKLTKHQFIAICITFFFIAITYFACDTKAKDIKLAEKSRENNLDVTSIENIKRGAFDSLSPALAAYYDGLQVQLSEAVDEDEENQVLEEISGFWYRNQEYALAGDVAKELANRRQTAESWSITGSTFAAGIRNATSDKKRVYNQKQAVQAFENAISLEPEEVNHQINLAICYAELPPADNPMKGILMLLEMDKSHPDTPGVLYQLARFGIQTGQYEKAIARLEKALLLEPNFVKASCLLSTAYLEIGNMEKAQVYKQQCELANNN